ncbi:MAG: MATE family efflux transporter [[Clostridium] innocuum]
MLKESCLNGSSEMVSQLAGCTYNTAFKHDSISASSRGWRCRRNNYCFYAVSAHQSVHRSAVAAPLISYQYGRKDTTRLLQLLRKCIKIVRLAPLIIFFTTILFQRPLVALFTDINTDVYAIALQGFVIFAFSLLFSGFNIFSFGNVYCTVTGRLSAPISFSRTFWLLSAVSAASSSLAGEQRGMAGDCAGRGMFPASISGMHTTAYAYLSPGR